MKKNNLKILIYDIEISPLLGASWKRYDTNLIWVDKEQYIMTIAYKWYGQNRTYVLGLPDYKLYKRNPYSDKELCKDFQKVVLDADILVGHNSDRFDNKHINARFILNGLEPMPKYKTIDTLKMAREFNFSSKRLNDLGEFFGVGNKIKTDVNLWRECMNGHKRAWAKMKTYNKQDVRLTEQIFDKMKSWAKLPNISYMAGLSGCPKCGSSNFIKRGFTYTQVSKFQRLKCNSCGNWFQERLATKDNKPDYK